MKSFDFGAFHKIMQMLSHDKIIFRVLFGVFHITSRTYNIYMYIGRALEY